MASSYCTGQHSSRLTLSCLRQSLPRGIRCTMKKKKKKRCTMEGTEDTVKHTRNKALVMDKAQSKCRDSTEQLWYLRSSQASAAHNKTKNKTLGQVTFSEKP